jgi:hypothetical protein
VKNGSPGRVVYAHPSWFETTYTVKFGHKREVITLFGLTKEDVQPG